MIEADVVKQDFSEGCNFNDEDENNNCWACQFFCFPIGCMHFESTLASTSANSNESTFTKENLEELIEMVKVAKVNDPIQPSPYVPRGQMFEYEGELLCNIQDEKWLRDMAWEYFMRGGK